MARLSRSSVDSFELNFGSDSDTEPFGQAFI